MTDCIKCNKNISKNAVRCTSCANRNRKGKYNLSIEARLNIRKACKGNKNHHVPHSEEAKKRMSLSHKNMSDETRKKIGESKKGNKNMLGKNHSKAVKIKHSKFMKNYLKNNPHPRGMLGKKHSENTKQNHSVIFSKENNPMWKGGLTTENQLLRASSMYRIWREAVFLRDNFTCQDCEQFGGYLEAHHIKSFAKFPDLRFDVNNGITYCKRCHVKNDTFRRVKNYA